MEMKLPGKADDPKMYGFVKQFVDDSYKRFTKETIRLVPAVIPGIFSWH